MSAKALLQRRSLLGRLLRAPRVFVGHYLMVRPQATVWMSLRLAWRLAWMVAKG